MTRHFLTWEPGIVVAGHLILHAALLESRLTVDGGRARGIDHVVFAVLVSSFVGVSLVFPGKWG